MSGFENVPVPLVVQCIDEVFIAVARVIPKFEPAQVFEFGPASITGIGITFNTIWSLASVHGEIAVECRVSVTEPESRSAALGVYVGIRVPAPERVPVPVEVQFTAV
jgi:hypothetical protein